MKDIVANLFVYIERTIGLKPPIVTVLGYHSISNNGSIVDVSPKEFKKQINYLAQHFEFVSVGDIVKYIKGEISINKPSVALTFDDGYQDLTKNVLPILNKKNIPACFFVLSEPQNANRHELANYKKLLTTGQIKKIKKTNTDIGSHTATHANLNTKRALLNYEISGSKEKLEKIIGFDVQYFAYPKGLYSKKIIYQLKKAKYTIAFTTRPGFIKKGQNIFLAPRVMVDRTHTLARFKAFFTYSGRFYLLSRMALSKIYQETIYGVSFLRFTNKKLQYE